MRHCIIVFLLLVMSMVGRSQTLQTLQADSVLLTNCDSTELILENHSQNIPGFLFNRGNGRTVFSPFRKLSDTLFLLGPDTLKNPYRWVQNGNSFGTTGIFGLRDKNPIDFYANNKFNFRLDTAGKMLVGSTKDDGYMLQVADAGKISFDPRLATPSDYLITGGVIGVGDGQDILFAVGNSVTSHSVLLTRNYGGYGHSGIGSGAPIGYWVGNPPFRAEPNGDISLASPYIYFGNTPDSANASALVTSVSNVNEWLTAGSYPSTQNHYYFGTQLSHPTAGKKRAPLKIAADAIHFMTGTLYGNNLDDIDRGMISEAGNFVIGSTVDSTAGKLHVNGTITGTGSLALGSSAIPTQLATTGSVRFAGIADTSGIPHIVTSDASGNLYYSDSSILATTNPVYSSLAVNGTVKAEKLTLHPQGWADYVFDSTYQLMPLTTLAKTIQQTHHLPGIPSAQAISVQGVDAGSMQVLLLKKIEEMTLYTIQGDKKATAFAHAVDQQQTELDNMEQRLTAIENSLKNKASQHN